MIDDVFPDDERNAYQRMTRREVEVCLKNAGIKCRPRITWEDGVKLLQANQIDVMKAIPWETVEVVGADGRKQTQMYPSRPKPAYDEAYEEKRDLEISRRLEAKAEKASKVEPSGDIKELKEQMAKITQTISQLAEVVLNQREELQEVAVKAKREKKPKETDPFKMKYMAQKKWLKEHGVELNKGDDPKILIQEVMDRENEQNAA